MTHTPASLRLTAARWLVVMAVITAVLGVIPIAAAHVHADLIAGPARIVFYAFGLLFAAQSFTLVCCSAALRRRLNSRAVHIAIAILWSLAAVLLLSLLFDLLALATDRALPAILRLATDLLLIPLVVTALLAHYDTLELAAPVAARHLPPPLTPATHHSAASPAGSPS